MDSACLISTLLINNFELQSIFFLYDLKIIQCVFLTFNDNLLALSQSTTFFSSSFRVLYNIFKFLPDINKLVSSANNMKNKVGETLTISLM